jgi:transposase-like protein
MRIDHSTMNRWIIKYSPQLEAAFHRYKRPVQSVVLQCTSAEAGVASCKAAENTLTRIEPMRMIHRGLIAAGVQSGLNSAALF